MREKKWDFSIDHLPEEGKNRSTFWVREHVVGRFPQWNSWLAVVLLRREEMAKAQLPSCGELPEPPGKSPAGRHCPLTVQNTERSLGTPGNLERRFQRVRIVFISS